MIDKIEPSMKLGKLTVVEESQSGTFGAKQWLCKCDCGNDVVLKENILLKEYINNCGCSSQFVDLTGQKFGLLTVLSRETVVLPNGRPQWLCRCDCGVEKVFSSDYLKDKRTKIPNCGHLREPKPKPEIKPGAKVGKLTIIKEADPGIRGGKQWLCKCDCGNDFIALDTALKGPSLRSCGCGHSFQEGNVTGQKYGRLEILYRTVDDPAGHPQFACKCDCGNVVLMNWGSLVRGSEVPSCGCYSSEIRAKKLTKHGLVGTPLHRVWNHMRERCNSPKDKRYKDYGGRGIYVCDRWDNKDSGLVAFVEDMGATYQPGLQLDRIDNNGPYSPENCRWVTSKENNRNRRDTLFINSILGEMTLAEFAEKIGLPYTEVYQRLRVQGYPGVFLTLKNKRGLSKFKPLFDGNGLWLNDKVEQNLNRSIDEVETQVAAFRDWGKLPDKVILADQKAE